MRPEFVKLFDENSLPRCCGRNGKLYGIVSMLLFIELDYTAVCSSLTDRPHDRHAG